MTFGFRFRLSLGVFLSIQVRGAGISLFRRDSVRGTIRISSDWGVEVCWVNLFNRLLLDYRVQDNICRPERLSNRTFGTRYFSPGEVARDVVEGSNDDDGDRNGASFQRVFDEDVLDDRGDGR